MNCAKARFLLYAHMDRELSKSDADALSRHLAVCGPCDARAKSARGLASVLRSRLDRAPAPDRLRFRLQNVPFFSEPIKPRTGSYVFAAALALLVVPLVTDARRPTAQAAAARTEEMLTATAGSAPLALVSKRMTGMFVCVQCEMRQEAGFCPIPAHRHVAAFCADNGEIWRLLTREPVGDESLGRTATLEGTAFPQSGFLRANRVGY
jgi:Putative zinc-finger